MHIFRPLLVLAVEVKTDFSSGTFIYSDDVDIHINIYTFMHGLLCFKESPWNENFVLLVV